MVLFRNRRSFTLLEILIGLSILVSVSSLFYVSVRSLFGDETFKASAYRLLSLSKNAVDLSQILHIDTEMQFVPKEGKVNVLFSPIGSLTASYDRWFQTMKISLDGIDSILLQGGEPKQEILFNDRGFDFSKGVLTFEGKESQAYILLPGYPAPLHLSFTPIDFQEFLREEARFEELLSASTFLELERYGN